MSSWADLAGQWSLVSALLDEALALPPPERAAWLAARENLAPEAKAELQNLLAMQAELDTSDFLQTLPSLAIAQPAGTVRANDRVGPYRLLRELGVGGMGAVWLAERADGQLKRPVALKLPRLTWAQDLAERMARERDILAGLSHPNIATLFDAGVDEQGRPYLAMEYVEGQAIDAYCDAKALGIAERIDLFGQVLDAVQHAHARLVIHRDLKPANIWVNAEGQVRLLDFGIARITTAQDGDHAGLTATGMRLFTPRYASPEQVLGAGLGVASDVYSLGVVLHELLTGSPPYVLRRASSAELELAIVESHLRAPSQSTISAEQAAARSSTPKPLAKALRGDLDAIVLRALARDASARYPSAEAFGADLQRWRSGLPVVARAPSTWVAIGKFIRRHPVGVGLGSLALASVLVASGVAVRMALQARDEAAQAKATRDYLVGLFENASPEMNGGKERTTKDLLLKSEAQLEGPLASQPRVKAAVLDSLANIWQSLGDDEKSRAMRAQRTQQFLKLDELKLAAESLVIEADSAAGVREWSAVTDSLSRAQALTPFDTLPVNRQAMVARLQGWAAIESRDYARALTHFDLALTKSLQAADPPEQILTLSGRAHTLRLLGRPADAATDLDAALRTLDSQKLPPKQYLELGMSVASNFYFLGQIYAGWPLMQSLAQRAAELYGPQSQAPMEYEIRRYWLRWCNALGTLETATRWLRAREAQQVRQLKQLDNNADALRIFAILWARAGDDARSRSALTQARLVSANGTKATDQASSTAWYASRAQADSALWLGRTNAAARVLTLANWNGGAQTLEQDGPIDRSTWLKDALTDAPAANSERDLWRLWRQGVICQRWGEYAAAMQLWNNALVIARAKLGDHHPFTAQIRLNLAIVKLKLAAKSQGGTVNEANDRAWKVLGDAPDVLLHTLGPEHKATKTAVGLAHAFQSGRLAQLASPQPFLDFGWAGM